MSMLRPPAALAGECMKIPCRADVEQRARAAELALERRDVAPMVRMTGSTT